MINKYNLQMNAQCTTYNSHMIVQFSNECTTYNVLMNVFSSIGTRKHLQQSIRLFLIKTGFNFQIYPEFILFAMSIKGYAQ